MSRCVVDGVRMCACEGLLFIQGDERNQSSAGFTGPLYTSSTAEDAAFAVIRIVVITCRSFRRFQEDFRRAMIV